MNNKVKVLLAFSILIAGLVLMPSCKKDQAPYSVNYQYNYYPLDSGHYVIYNVDSILYSYNGIYTRDTVHYQWMQVVADTFYDNENRINYRLECYRRPDSLSSWSIDRVWYAFRSTTNLQVQEDDIRFVKLIFPPQLNASWSGNEYVPITTNTSDPYSVYQNWTYYYENMDTTYTLNGVAVNHALVVSEVNQEDLINKVLRTEAYVQGVGMVYQKWFVGHKQDVNKPWATGTETGFSVEMKMWAHNP